MDPTRIDQAFDPSTIKPGLYVTRSGSPGYPAARFLVESGKATGLDHFLPDGQIDLTFQVTGKQKRNPAEGEGFERTGTIKVTKKWFKSRTREYANWKIAWWREAIQNSINPHTGNASRVDLICKEGPDGNWIASCADNGRGMTRQQIEDEEKGFLVFGGSGASEYGGMGGIGGFGEAKQLLIFPWLQYRVMTADQEYVGSGQDWKARAAAPRQGVLLEVIMPADSHTTPEDALHVLKRSWLPQVTFTLNGAVVSTGMPTTGQPLDQVDGQGIIYSSPKMRGESPELVVRKGGLWTFSKALPPSAKHGIIVEVTGNSTEMFTTNRDGFGYGARKLEQKLVENVREISTEGRLRAKLKPIERIVRGTGKFSTVQKKEQELPQRSYDLRDVAGPLPPVRDASEGTKLSDEQVGKIVKKLEGFTEEDIAALGDVTPEEGSSSGAGSASGLENLVQIATASPAAAMVMLQLMNFKGQKSMDAAIKQMVWKPDFLLLKDADMAYSIPKKFTPEDMTPAVLRLTKTWTELCRFILISVGEEATYGVGFWFSEDAAAGYLYRKQEHWLLLNPHKDSSRKEIWTPTNQEDLSMLWAMAIHEVSHMLVRLHQGYGYEHDDAPPEPASHGSEMANEQTHLQAKLAPSWMTVRKIASAIKLRGQVPGKEVPIRKPPTGKKPSAKDSFDAEQALAELNELAYQLQGAFTKGNAILAFGAFFDRMTIRTQVHDGKDSGMLDELRTDGAVQRRGFILKATPRDQKYNFHFRLDESILSPVDAEVLRSRIAALRDYFADAPDSESEYVYHVQLDKPFMSPPVVPARDPMLGWDESKSPAESFIRLGEFLSALANTQEDPTSENVQRAADELDAFMSHLTQHTEAYDNANTGYRKMVQALIQTDKGYKNGVLLVARPRDWNAAGNKPTQYKIELYADMDKLGRDDTQVIIERAQAVSKEQALSETANMITWIEVGETDPSLMEGVERANPAPETSGDLKVQALPGGHFGVVHDPTGTWLTRRQTQDRARAIAKHFGTGGGQALLKAALAGDQGAMDAVSLAVSESKKGEQENPRAIPVPSNAPLVLWHGSQRWEGPPTLQPAGKRKSEYGSGLYLTTSSERARKYAKGGGTVLRFEIAPDLVWLDDVTLTPQAALEFVRSMPRLKKRGNIEADIQRNAARSRDGQVRANVIENLLVNYDALKGDKGPALAKFYVSLGIDASLVHQSGEEDWVILYNLDKILRYDRVPSGQVVDSPRIALPNPAKSKTPQDAVPANLRALADRLRDGHVLDRFGFKDVLVWQEPNGTIRLGLRGPALRLENGVLADDHMLANRNNSLDVDLQQAFGLDTRQEREPNGYVAVKGGVGQTMDEPDTVFGGVIDGMEKMAEAALGMEVGVGNVLITVLPDEGTPYFPGQDPTYYYSAKAKKVLEGTEPATQTISERRGNQETDLRNEGILVSPSQRQVYTVNPCAFSKTIDPGGIDREVMGVFQDNTRIMVAHSFDPDVELQPEAAANIVQCNGLLYPSLSVGPIPASNFGRCSLISLVMPVLRNLKPYADRSRGAWEIVTYDTDAWTGTTVEFLGIGASVLWAQLTGNWQPTVYYGNHMWTLGPRLGEGPGFTGGTAKVMRTTSNLKSMSKRVSKSWARGMTDEQVHKAIDANPKMHYGFAEAKVHGIYPMAAFPLCVVAADVAKKARNRLSAIGWAGELIVLPAKNPNDLTKDLEHAWQVSDAVYAYASKRGKLTTIIT